MEVLTWSRVLRRARAVADELRLCGSTGDRVAIVAPQSLDYIVAFLGVLQAGLIAVPLPAPQLGIHDQRMDPALPGLHRSSFLRPCRLLTRSASTQRRRWPRHIDLRLPLWRWTRSTRTPRETSMRPGMRIRTRRICSTPRGRPASPPVSLCHRNVIANCEQLMSDYFEDTQPVPTTAVSWLPFYHDMGLLQGIILPMFESRHRSLDEPGLFFATAGPVDATAGQTHRTSFQCPNFGFELAARRTSDDDMAGLDLGDVRAIISGGERPNPATLKRFADRFARFNLDEAVIRPSYGLAEATVYVASAGGPGTPTDDSTFGLRPIVSRHGGAV